MVRAIHTGVVATQEELRRIFRERDGEVIDGAVEAFSGMYPVFGGWGNWEMLITRHP
jgi:hypothetical protein